MEKQEKSNTLPAPIQQTTEPKQLKKKGFIDKFNKLISYDYKDELINVEHSIDAIRQTILQHNLRQRDSSNYKRHGYDDIDMLDDRGPNNFKSTLRKTSSHALDGGRVLNNKFNTIGSHRQKRVQFAINADIDHT